MALSVRWVGGDKTADKPGGKTTTIGGWDWGNGTALGSVDAVLNEEHVLNDVGAIMEHE
ncbi:hypothetical protein Q9L58_005872 [Maublancomyces gigas]|uniref:Uncharacterized protein n=1 Tax=Discina gigas TaxID=1032678 RepID=A0ABR3GH19_9PEZI